MDIDLLIKKVYQNPPIWNKNHKLYTSRFAVDKAWLDIGGEMGISEVKLRKKWKYLRDQFSVEHGMTLKGARESKWPHYHALMFLKDVIKPRTLFKRRLVDDSNASSAADDHKHGEASSSRVREASGNNNDDDSQSSSAPNDDKGPSSGPVARPKREKVSDAKPAADSAYVSKGPSSMSSGVNSMQGRVAFGRRDSHSESDDLLFFKSLLPHVERLPPRAKLQFRMQVLRVVDDFVYSGASRSAPNGSEVIMAETVYSSYESDDQSDTPPPPQSPPPSRSKRK